MSTRWDTTGPATKAQRKRVAKLGPFYLDWGSQLGSIHRVSDDEIVALVTDKGDAIALISILNEVAS